MVFWPSPAAREFVGLLTEQKLKQGLIFGGMIAWVLAIEHPELVGRMGLGSSSTRVQDAQYRVLEDWVRLGWQRPGTGRTCIWPSGGRSIRRR